MEYLLLVYTPIKQGIKQRFNEGKSEAEGTCTRANATGGSSTQHQSFAVVEGERTAFEHQLSCTGCSDVNQLTWGEDTAFAEQEGPGEEERCPRWATKEITMASQSASKWWDLRSHMTCQ